jgi:hypothetical protein
MTVPQQYEMIQNNNPDEFYDEEQYYEAADERTLSFCFNCSQQ